MAGLTAENARGWTTLVCDSLEKIFPDTAPRAMDPALTLKAWRGGKLSFQIAVLPPLVDKGAVVPHPPEGLLPGVKANVVAPSGVSAAVSSVELVPARFLAFENHDDNYLRDDAGLWPDPMRPLGPDDAAKVFVGQWHSIWVELEISANAAAGASEVEVVLETSTGQPVGTHKIAIEVFDITVDTQALPITQWMHCDGIAQYYGIEPFTEEFWTSVDAFMASANDIGVNSLLTPVWTPTLDTAVGNERLPVQLVQITGDDEHYTFDFSRLRRWLELLRKNGIAYVEVSHFFTQWGAESTPAIYVTRDGVTKREFGWDVSATDPRYRELLEQLVPQLRALLDAEWGLDKVFFHISDEPTAEMAGTYRAAQSVVADLIEGCRVIDAMSAFSLYSEGIVQEPVVSSDHAQAFLDAKVDRFWLYYCVGQNRDVSNRFFAMPPSRNRVFGTQLYLTGVAGFLHWGFNFYNTYLSRRAVNPFLEPDAGGAFPAGDPFIVYPGPDFTVWHSIRGKVFGEAMEDLALMQTLERLAGEAAVREIVDPAGDITLSAYPHDPNHFLTTRNRLIEAIAAQGK